jgi:NTP pyrophosphatase (non-canonical NTP hydrolase)
MEINELVVLAHKTAKDKGWYDNGAGENIPEKIALIHSEASEALEEYRHGRLDTWIGDNGKPEGLPIELADIVIRVAEFCGKFKIDLNEAIELKQKYNESRPYRHGGKVC